MLTAAVYDTKPYDRDYLQKAAGAFDIDWHFFDFRLNAKTAPAAQGARSVCVFVNDQLDKACVETLAAGGIRHISLRCAGFNRVDLAAARDAGISVTRVPAYSPHAVAEHAVGLILTLNRKIHQAYNRVRELNFSLHGLVGFDISGKTVGIVGTGKIGRVTAEIFRGFRAKVIAYDPFPNEEWARGMGVQYVSFKELLKESDVLSLHVPLTPEVFHLLNAEAFALMKKGVFIVNTSRGELIDTKALIQSLKSGHVGGVGLDVYEDEEGIFFEDLSGKVLQDDELSRLLTFPNVLITAHQAFLTVEALQEISRVTVDNILRLSRGEACLEGTAVNP